MNLKLTLLLPLLLAATASFGRASLLSIYQPSVSANVGDTFEMAVLIQGLDPTTGGQDEVSAFNFDVLFPTFLQVQADPVELGTFASYGCCFSWNGIDNTNGVISDLSDFEFGPGVSNDALALIWFTAVAPGTGEVSLSNVSLSDSDGNAIPFVVLNGGEVTVSQAAPPPPDNSSTPEPATWLLMMVGTAGIAMWSNRRQTKSSK